MEKSRSRKIHFRQRYQSGHFATPDARDLPIPQLNKSPSRKPNTVISSKHKVIQYQSAKWEYFRAVLDVRMIRAERLRNVIIPAKVNAQKSHGDSWEYKNTWLRLLWLWYYCSNVSPLHLQIAKNSFVLCMRVEIQQFKQCRKTWLY